MRLHRVRGIQAGGGGDGGNDDIGIAHGIGRGGGAAHAGRLAGASEPFTFGSRKQYIPCGDALDAGLAQPCRYGLAGFAKADETQRRFHLRHAYCLARIDTRR